MPKTQVRLLSLGCFFKEINEVSFLPISTLISSIFAYVFLCIATSVKRLGFGSFTWVLSELRVI
jgi:hypothetical protein